MSSEPPPPKPANPDSQLLSSSVDETCKVHEKGLAYTGAELTAEVAEGQAKPFAAIHPSSIETFVYGSSWGDPPEGSPEGFY